MEYKDYYKTLGVDKRRHRKRDQTGLPPAGPQAPSRRQPRRPQAEERFKEINEAYEVLSDPEKRSKYDRLGADWQRWQQTRGGPGDFDWGRWTGGQPGDGVHVRYGTPEDLEDLFGGGSPFSDFFSQIFGGMGGSRGGGFQYQGRPQPRSARPGL